MKQCIQQSECSHHFIQLTVRILKSGGKFDITMERQIVIEEMSLMMSTLVLNYNCIDKAYYCTIGIYANVRTGSYGYKNITIRGTVCDNNQNKISYYVVCFSNMIFLVKYIIYFVKFNNIGITVYPNNKMKGIQHEVHSARKI